MFALCITSTDDDAVLFDLLSEREKDENEAVLKERNAEVKKNFKRIVNSELFLTRYILILEECSFVGPIICCKA